MDGLLTKLREFSELRKSYWEYSGIQNQNLLVVEQSITKLIDFLNQYRTQWELLTATITTSQTTARNEATFTQQLEATMYNLRVTAMQEFLAAYSQIQVQITTIDAAIKSSIASLTTSVNASADAYDRQANSIRDAISAKEEEAAAKKNKYNGDRTSRYAVETKSAKRSDYAIVDEQGEEMIVSGRYKFIEKGDTVFPAQATNNLWNFGSNPSRFLQEHFKNIVQPQINMNLSPISPAGNTTVQIGDIHLSHVTNADILARDIVNRLPGKVLQNLRKR